MCRIHRLSVILVALGALAAGPPEAVRAEYERESATCIAKLQTMLDDASYTHALRLDWSEDSPSIVDATESLAEREGVQVAVLWDGTRMHAVAPFLTHRRARSLVRYAETLDESPLYQFCIFARAIQEDAGERAFQRTTLATIAVAAWAAGGWLLLGIGRATEHKDRSA